MTFDCSICGPNIGDSICAFLMDFKVERDSWVEIKLKRHLIFGNVRKSQKPLTFYLFQLVYRTSNVNMKRANFFVKEQNCDENII